MKISVKLYGDMAQYAPGENDQFILTIEPGSSLQNILKHLAIPASGYVSLINGRRVDSAYCFQNGDTLVLFPELCGG